MWSQGKEGEEGFSGIKDNEEEAEGFESEGGLQSSEGDCRELKGQRDIGENAPSLASKHPGLGPQVIHHLTCQKEAQQ